MEALRKKRPDAEELRETRPGAEELRENGLYMGVVEAYDSGGAGIVKPCGAVAFVPGTVRGETVEFRVTRKRKRFAEAEAARILTPSPMRRAPDCPYFGECGGCDFRHMAYEEELRAKRQRVQDALTRIGGADIEVEPVIGADVGAESSIGAESGIGADIGAESAIGAESPIGAERPFRYRGKCQYPVSASGVIGFYRAGSHEVVDVRECLLQPSAANRTADAVRDWMARYRVPGYDERTGKGLIRHVYVRVNRRGESLCCLVANGKTLPKEPELVGMILERVPGTLGVVVNTNTRRDNVILGERYRTIWGQNFLYDVLRIPSPDGMRELSPDGMRELSPDGAEKPSSPDGAEKPSSPDSAEKPSSPDGAEKLSSPDGAEKPSSPDGAEKLSSPDGAEKPSSPDGAEKPSLPDGVRELSFKLSLPSFYQVNAAQTEKLYALALECAALTGNETVLDLYCGIGTITLSLALWARRAIGAEIVERAVADAKENASRNGITNAEFLCADASELARAVAQSDGAESARAVAQPDVSELARRIANADASKFAQRVSADGLRPDVVGLRPDVVTVDPPRKGLTPEGIAAIASMGPSRVVYVSCDPGTLARDVRLFAGYGYAVRRAVPVDMFPGTRHVETVALLTREAAATESR